jgi:DNA-binding beta-propeller fold protein YncE
MPIFRSLIPSFLLCCSLTVAGAAQDHAAHAATPKASHAIMPSQASQASSSAPAQTKQLVPTPNLDAPLPGMPPVLNPNDLYTADRPNQLSDVVKNFPSRVYVPNTISNTVDVIDPATFRIIDHFAVDREPQHVVPSYDLKTLWVANDQGNTLTKIDPATGKKGETVAVEDPYNLYFTPNGEDAIVAAERMHRLDFRDPQTMKLKYSLHVPCAGVNHMDFSANGRYAIVACEFDGQMLKLDVAGRAILSTMKFSGHSMPQDVRLSPDGKLFYVADMAANGLHVIDGARFADVGFIPTGKGTHGLYISRDSKYLYISNRGEGSISVMEFATQKLVNKWKIPNGGSPDMGGISADGKVFWIAGRYNSEVYAFDTENGKLLARIPVGKGPHGLCVYPQPGRYSMGHTGVYR